MGAAEAAAWLSARGISSTSAPHWFVEIRIDSDQAGIVFDLNIYPEEWGFVVRRSGLVSSIRVTDVAFVHGRDELRLLSLTPTLARIGSLVVELERRFDTHFQCERAAINSNLPRAIGATRAWLLEVDDE